MWSLDFDILFLMALVPCGNSLLEFVLIMISNSWYETDFCSTQRVDFMQKYKYAYKYKKFSVT